VHSSASWGVSVILLSSALILFSTGISGVISPPSVLIPHSASLLASHFSASLISAPALGASVFSLCLCLSASPVSAALVSAPAFGASLLFLRLLLARLFSSALISPSAAEFGASIPSSPSHRISDADGGVYQRAQTLARRLVLCQFSAHGYVYICAHVRAVSMVEGVYSTTPFLGRVT
jgi:hypothetical protein